MSVLSKLASSLGRRDEIPNQMLAKEIAEAEDKAAVEELITHLSDASKAIQSDCIKVLYEIGALKPWLIDGYIDTFVRLLRSRNNRLVWGGMTALGWIAAWQHRGKELWAHIDVIMDATEKGSAITQDWGIHVLATASSQDPTYQQRIFPFLIRFLERCPPKDLPRHAESALVAVDAGNRAEMLALLDARKDGLKPAQRKRIEQLIRKLKAGQAGE
jgi:hypothetical protein